MHSGVTYSKRNGVLIVDNNAISDQTIPLPTEEDRVRLNSATKSNVSFKKPYFTGRSAISRPQTGKTVATDFTKNPENSFNPYSTSRAPFSQTNNDLQLSNFQT